jgi:ABC-type multidrug transport system fused ATPase/permease subunit
MVVQLNFILEFAGLIGVQRKLGLMESAYWVAQYITIVSLAILSSGIALLSRFSFYEGFILYNVSGEVMFVIYVACALHFFSMVQCIVALTNRRYACDVVFQIVLSVCDIINMFGGGADDPAILKSEGYSFFVTLIFRSWLGGWICSLIPIFPLGKLFFEIRAIAQHHRVNFQMEFWNLRSFFTESDYQIPTEQFVKFDVPSPKETLLFMLVASLAFTLLSWYANQVIGGPKHPMFLFSRTFWQSKAVSTDLDQQSKEQQSLIVRNLKCTFRAAFSNRIVKEAVRDVSFQVRKGQILALLGKNGAGTCTTIPPLLALVLFI